MNNIERRQSRWESITWWRKYLISIYNPCGRQSILIPHATFFAYTMPWVLLMFVTAATVYISLSENYFNRMTEKSMARATTKEQLEALERAEEATKPILRNPVMKTKISFEIAIVSIRSLLMILIIAWLLLYFLSEEKSNFSNYILVASSSTGIIVLGNVIHTLLKLWFEEEIIGVSPILFIKLYNSSNPIHYILARCDIFMFYFFWTVSIQILTLFQEKVITLVTVFLSTWFILLLMAFLFDFTFYVIPV